MKGSLLVVLLISAYFPGLTQIKVHGKVTDAKDQSALGYVNIGILNSPVGTISDLDGSFAITVPETYSKGVLAFSALGYAKVSLSIDSLARLSTVIIALSESAIQLATVDITANRSFRKHYIGNPDTEGGCTYADTASAGSSIALLIEADRSKKMTYPAFVNQATLVIAMNTFEEFKVRVRFYAVDSATGMPGKDLFERSIVQTSRMRRGQMKFNLSGYTILMSGPFYIAFEWILEKADRRYLQTRYETYVKKHPNLVTTQYSIVDGQKIAYTNYNGFWAGTSFGISVRPENLTKYKCYYRFNSFGAWNRSSSILSADVILVN